MTFLQVCRKVTKRQGPIKNRRFIDDRPAIVDDKKRVGDWEIDTIIGKERKQAIVTIVERVSKKTVLKKVRAKTALRCYINWGLVVLPNQINRKQCSVMTNIMLSICQKVRSLYYRRN